MKHFVVGQSSWERSAAANGEVFDADKLRFIAYRVDDDGTFLGAWTGRRAPMGHWYTTWDPTATTSIDLMAREAAVGWASSDEVSESM